MSKKNEQKHPRVEYFKDLDYAMNNCINTFQLALDLKDLEIAHLKRVIEIYKKEE